MEEGYGGEGGWRGAAGGMVHGYHVILVFPTTARLGAWKRSLISLTVRGIVYNIIDYGAPSHKSPER